MAEVKGLQIEIVDTTHPLRKQVETFARRAYKMQYNANLQTYCRELLIVKFPKDKIAGCIGINLPGAGSIFLEQYLDRPVEDEISDMKGVPVSREEIVEVGTLATYRSGMCRLLMAGLAGYLLGNNIRFIVFTSVKSLRNTMARLNVPLHKIADASIERLSSESDQWGSYYEASPEVIWVDLRESLFSLDKILGSLDYSRPAIDAVFDIFRNETNKETDFGNNGKFNPDDLLGNFFMKGFALSRRQLRQSNSYCKTSGLLSRNNQL